MPKKVAILGGTGFVGKHLIHRLADRGWQIVALTRWREKNRDLLVLPTVKLISVNPYQPKQLNAPLVGCDAVINLVGILNEIGSDGAGFRKVHVELSQRVVDACRVNGIKRLLHMSALHADAINGKSHYLRTKGEAENEVHAKTDLQVTSFRPSVIFGEDDSFFNRFAQILRLPALFFPVPCPNTQFAPVWVDDVVEAMVRSLEEDKHIGKRYNLCGPSVYTHQVLWEQTAKWLGLRRWAFPLSDKNTQRLARLGDLLPIKPFSTDNYLSLQQDSICTENHFAELGITPTSVEAIMPRYFSATTPRGYYSRFRAFSHR
jgi:uncharacterized protein YbjT (DUF2867 family)